MEITDKMQLQLAQIIANEIKADFNIRHLSMNLVNTIKISQTENGWAIDIPAQMYDIGQFTKKGVIINTWKGSYASRIDTTGGFSRTHKDYVDRSIRNGIAKWLALNGLEGRLK